MARLYGEDCRGTVPRWLARCAISGHGSGTRRIPCPLPLLNLAPLRVVLRVRSFSAPSSLDPDGGVFTTASPVCWFVWPGNAACVSFASLSSLRVERRKPFQYCCMPGWLLTCAVRRVGSPVCPSAFIYLVSVCVRHRRPFSKVCAPSSYVLWPARGKLFNAWCPPFGRYSVCCA